MLAIKNTNALHVALRKETHMIRIRFAKPIESAPFSRDGMDEDTVTLGHEDIEFDISFKQAALYFAPENYMNWTIDKKYGFIEAIKNLYYMDLLDQAIEDSDFKTWAYENFYTNN
jgi:hypothetical protein